MRPRSTYILLLAFAACGKSAARQGLPDTLHLALLDSAWSTKPWDAMAEGMFTYRVRVLHNGRADTLVDVIPPLPFLVHDTVVGFVLDTATTERQTFRYTVAPGRLERFPLPSDVWYFFHDVAIAPDGRHLFYLASDSAGNEWAAVRNWPRGEVAVTGPRRSVCECDVDLHHARWAAADTFQLATEVGRDLWELVTGTVSGGSFKIDTIRGEPQWH